MEAACPCYEDNDKRKNKKEKKIETKKEKEEKRELKNNESITTKSEQDEINTKITHFYVFCEVLEGEKRYFYN